MPHLTPVNSPGARQRIRRRAGVAGLAVAVALLAGCGSGPGPTTKKPEPDPAAAAAAASSYNNAKVQEGNEKIWAQQQPTVRWAP